MKCKDPCPGMCAPNANCYVLNHAATCTCFEQYTGDPFINCNPLLPTRKAIDISNLYKTYENLINSSSTLILYRNRFY